MIRYERPLTDDLLAPTWPPGVSLGTAAPGELHELMRLAYGDVTTTTDEWWQWLTTDSEYDPDLLIVALADGRAVGMAQCWTSSFIKDFVVHPDWHNRGLGTALLHEAFARLRARGHGAIVLKTDDDNVGAQRLYARMGFVPTPGP
jgi:ribosomal protein S18 acetylase RimI-like enzyme